MIVYVLNPGSTSTKMGLATVVQTPKGVSAFVEKVEVQHPPAMRLADDGAVAMSLDGTGPYAPIGMNREALEQIRAAIRASAKEWGMPNAIAARGGLIGPCAAGTYRVTSELARYSISNPFGVHSSNFGAQLALEWAESNGVPAFIVDPPTVDELLPEARVTGVPGLERRSRFHALNSRACARRAALEVGKRFEDAVIVVAHLGGGVSVTAFERGRAVDTTGALLDEGPFSAQRAGSLPTEGLLELAYKMPRAILEHQLTRESGFQGLVGTNDLRSVQQREAEDPVVGEAVRAFVHQIAKHIGAYSAASSRPDAIVLTGGAARWTDLMQRLETRLSWIAPLIVIPGELEMEALAEGAGRVLFGHEEARAFKIPA
jgi:butyrate kinase